jgi:membrane protease YdiL (CAAX protease family)
MMLWTCGIASTFLFVIYPRVVGANPWWSAVAQVLAYGMIALPILVFSRETFALYRASHRQWLLSAALLILGGSYAYWIQRVSEGELLRDLIRLLATGFVEELVFRGYIFSAIRRVTKNLVAVVAVNIGLFCLYHIPAAIYQHQVNPAQFAAYAIFALVACVVRIVSKRLVIPTGLHIGWDLSQ